MDFFSRFLNFLSKVMRFLMLISIISVCMFIKYFPYQKYESENKIILFNPIVQKYYAMEYHQSDNDNKYYIDEKTRGFFYEVEDSKGNCIVIVYGDMINKNDIKTGSGKFSVWKCFYTFFLSGGSMVLEP